MNTKNKILSLLEQYRGQSIYGSKIAEMLGISRNAVWKAIKELEKDGYKITAGTNKGYCLECDNDIISAAGISPYLVEKSVTDRIFVHESLESTNTTAKELAIAGAEHGTVVIAESQSGGKGRYGRSFLCPAGHGIYMSIILRPHDFGGNSVMITSYAAVAVCEAVEKLTGKNPRIKWVNDVFIGDKKICGILTEAVTDFESGGVQWVVVGIGINFLHSDALPEVAGALFDKSPPITRNRLSAEVIDRILVFDGTCNISEYRERLMWVGEKVTATGHGQVTVIDVDDEARLLVQKEDSSEIITLSSGEISIRNAV
jgi:BirA family biotin operon repressor/biotin-[acetyl-CoA-carboxylase] ligase